MRRKLVAAATVAFALAGLCRAGREGEAPAEPSRTRGSGSAGASPSPAGHEGVVGQWLFRNAQSEIRAEFGADGRYTRSLRSAQETKTEGGTYRVAEGILELRPDGQKEAVRLKCRLVDPNTLEVTDADGDGIRLVRQAAPSPAAQPPALSPKALPPPPVEVVPQPGSMTAVLRPALPLPQHPAGHILYSRIHMLQLTTPLGPMPYLASRLYVMNGDGSNPAPFLTTQDIWTFKQARWSPRYDRLAFTSDFQSARSVCYEDIFVVNADGTGLRRLTGGELRGAPPAGFGAIEGTIRDNVGQDPTEPGPLPYTHSRICIAAQGSDGQIYHPSPAEEVEMEIDPMTGKLRPVTGPKDPTKQHTKERQYKFQIPKCAAGKIWVRVWVDRWIGNVVIADVRPGAVTDIGAIELSMGNYFAGAASLTPDGQYAVGVSGITSFHVGKGSPTKTPTTTGGTAYVSAIQMADGKCVALFEPTRALGLNASDPAVSPDGQWVAVAWGMPFSTHLAVVSLQDLLANTPRPRVVVPEEKRPFETTYLGAANPAWSPDGRMLAFSRTVMVRHFVSGDLCVVNADGSGLRQLTRAGPNQFCAQPCFSPDGRRIVFAILTGRQGPLAIEQLLLLQFSADLYVVNLDGSGLTRLTSDGVSCEPAWGP